MSKLVSKLGIPTINRGTIQNKKCIICLEFKNRNEFPPSAYQRSDYRCTKCANIRASRWREKNPIRCRQNGVRGERKYLLKWYGVTPEWYESKLLEQHGRCAICGTCKNGSKKHLDVDHCHKTGKVRGLLCNRCNTGIGQLKDNEQILLSAISYLRVYGNG